MDGLGVALRPGQLRGRGVGIDVSLVFLRRDAGDRQANSRIRHIDQQIDAIIEPLPRQTRADIRLVLVVAFDDGDIIAFVGGPEILQRLLDTGDRRLATDIAIGAGEIAAHTDGERFAGGAGGQQRQRASHRGGAQNGTS